MTYTVVLCADQQDLFGFGVGRERVFVLPEMFHANVALELAEQGKVWLHRHAYPAQAKKEDVVKDDKGNYYMGIVLRR